ncbi:tetratricopeptide repeat protein [Phenylobacterium sp.]|jgi:tetratricopeptide (TPR) repeat protein|uniref:tetratricopeptide repeat protein n=1 Tax=Phenylobacterium sp. TaxID=1871053 RepID=UPI002F938B06
MALSPHEAVDAADAAVQAQPQSGRAHYQHGLALSAVGRLDEAAEAFTRAVELEPEQAAATLGLGQVRLAQGDYERGWPLCEARKLIPSQNARPLPMPGEWQGEALAGRSLLIWPEQGFGDQIQFARFAPVLAAQGARVTLVTDPPLTHLFRTLGVEVLARGDSFPVPDHWTLALSIPRWRGTTLETIPAAPYLRVPDDRRAKWAGHGPKGAVGFAWRGRPTHPNDRHRSLPSPELLTQPLQAAGATLIDLTEPVGDFADLAAMVAQLDLVVTVDTALAHLAGALGRPCFVLLPWLRTDWRWLRDRSDSPWYPSLRLFRQPSFGDWTSVIGAVAAAYEDLRP